MRIVSKDNPLPLHYQIKQVIQEMIENEELKPGDVIPTERELCEIQGVSRMTVNKAIMSLVNEGILYREQGKGTFVSEPKEKRQLSQLKGFTEEMEEKGLKTSTKILSFEIKDATKKNKTILNMPENEDKVIEINRLRIRENEPIALETVWLPRNLFSDMTRDTIEGKSLYKVFKEKYKYDLKKAKQTIEPIALNEYESGLLGLEEDALALMFRRTTYMEDGIPIEYTKAIYRSDKYKYEIILT
ncbi:GntR family transcriptional regulator [Clostridium aciditolerans]|uniref:GntR family transcriptional regulator n=1 Tax=Clostridium aciditolerans TaxID=339861 RepID=A0A934HTQ6_9CLOT|nr:GntR family transcriptional regulator [Clostridium aciditolerans]MBI6874145.1 GntR family transcriptional regulator [Clostridium aciditolerans]